MKGHPFEALGRALIGLFHEHAVLLTLETMLAKQSIAPFFISLGCLIFFALSTWVMLIILAIYGITLWTQNIQIALASVGVFFLFSLIFTIFMVKMYLQRLQFKETRSHLKLYLENEDES